MTKKNKFSSVRFNDEFDVNEKDIVTCKYFFKSDHRDGTAEKSQWTIDAGKELNCFVLSHKNQWTGVRVSWGIHIVKNKAIELGRNFNDTPLNVAVFYDSFKKNVWHGYPADFKRNAKDIPSTNVLVQWREKNYIKKHKISKAQQGKVCSL